MLVVQRNGTSADLTVARELDGRGVIIIANPAAGRARLLAMAALLLEPLQCEELAALLPPDHH